MGLVHHTAATLGAALALAETTQSDYKKAGKAVSTAGDTLKTADGNGKGLITLAREALKPSLGKTFNPDWAVVGFKNNSLAVPDHQDERLALLNQMNKYFTDNPAMEINTPKLVVTAAAAKGFWQGLFDGQKGVEDAEEDYLVKQTARDNADLALRAEMTGMIGNWAICWTTLTRAGCGSG